MVVELKVKVGHIWWSFDGTSYAIWHTLFSYIHIHCSQTSYSCKHIICTYDTQLRKNTTGAGISCIGCHWTYIWNPKWIILPYHFDLHQSMGISTKMNKFSNYLPMPIKWLWDAQNEHWDHSMHRKMVTDQLHFCIANGASYMRSLIISNNVCALFGFSSNS